MVIYCRRLSSASILDGRRLSSREQVALKLLKVDDILARRRVTSSKAVILGGLVVGRYRGLKLQVHVVPLLSLYRCFVLVFPKAVSIAILPVGEDNLAR